MRIKAFRWMVFLALALAFAATTARAVPMLEYSGDTITGITGLTVEDIVYNATFHGSALDGWGTGDFFDVYDERFADRAVYSALWPYLDGLPSGSYRPSDIVGCEFTVGGGDCSLVTVTAVRGGLPYLGPSVKLRTPKVVCSGEPPMNMPCYLYDEGTPIEWTYVSWEAAYAVPEPPIALLMVSGLIVFGVTRREHRA